MNHRLASTEFGEPRRTIGGADLEFHEPQSFMKLLLVVHETLLQSFMKVFGLRPACQPFVWQWFAIIKVEVRFTSLNAVPPASNKQPARHSFVSSWDGTPEAMATPDHPFAAMIEACRQVNASWWCRVPSSAIANNKTTPAVRH